MISGPGRRWPGAPQRRPAARRRLPPGRARRPYGPRRAAAQAEAGRAPAPRRGRRFPRAAACRGTTARRPRACPAAASRSRLRGRAAAPRRACRVPRCTDPSNVAALVDTPKGQAGRPSKSLTLDQASALLAAAADTRMRAYIALCPGTGIRTEEARALRWEHINLGNPYASPPLPASAAVWRSVRAHGDSKTDKSRRTLALPRMAAVALRALKDQQAAAAERSATSGTSRISSSPPGPASPWTPPTSSASSAPSARPRTSDRAGPRASCDTPSSPPPPAFPSRKSPGSPGTPAHAPPKSSTAANSAPSSPPAPKSWTPSSRDKHRAIETDSNCRLADAAARTTATSACSLNHRGFTTHKDGRRP